MKRIQLLVTTISFIIIVFSFFVISLFDGDDSFSMMEKRSLKSKPSFSLTSLFNGTYTKELEEYYSDTFPFRESFIKLNVKLGEMNGFSDKDGIVLHKGNNSGNLSQGESLILQPSVRKITKNPSATSTPWNVPPKNTPSAIATTANKVPDSANIPDEPNMPVFEDHSTLYVMGDRIVEAFYYSDESCSEYLTATRSMASRLENVKFYSLITPTSSEFYTPEKYHSGFQSQKNAINYIYDTLKNTSNIKPVDAYSYISKHTDEYIYFRSDHHWTQRGAYYGYQAFAEAAGFQAEPMNKFGSGQINGFLGSFYGQLPNSKLEKNPDYVELFMPFVKQEGKIYMNLQMNDPYVINAVRTDVDGNNKYLVFISGDNALTLFDTGINNGKSILVFKDSFGNAFVPFLLAHYEKVYVVDPRYLDEDIIAFIKEKGIQEVLFMNYSIAASDSQFNMYVNRLIKS